MLQEYIEIITFGFLIIDGLLISRDLSSFKFKSSNTFEMLGELLWPTIEFDYAVRLVCFLILVSCIYTLISIRFYRKTPLTILRTEINIRVNRNRNRAVFEKTQTIRANLPNVTAYYTMSEPSSSVGKCAEVLMYSDCAGAKLVDEIEFTNPHDARGFEAIHSFGRALRYRWYMLLVPKMLMNKSYLEIPMVFRRNLTLRTQEFVCLNEFNQPKPSIEFTAKDYPQRKIYVFIEFEGELPKNIKTRRVALHGMVDVPAVRVSRNSIRIYINKLFRETLRISWDEEAPLPLLERVDAIATDNKTAS